MNAPRDLNKKTVPQLHNVLWPLFAKYIKQVHSFGDGWCRCYTCDKPIQIGTHDCQAGHFVGRGKGSTKYDERNVRPQCVRCNYGGGESQEFERRLRLEIGDDAVDELLEKSQQKWKWQRPYLIELIEFCREELKEIA